MISFLLLFFFELKTKNIKYRKLVEHREHREQQTAQTLKFQHIL